MSATATDVVELLAAAGVVPVVTIDDAEDAAPLATALVAGGLAVIEITLRTPAAIEAIARVAAEVPAATVGAGSVMTAADADAAIDAGARFVVSPGFDDGVVGTARERSTRAIPGVATATELQRAANAGVDVVKLFPAAVAGGPALIEALTPVWPHVRFVPTGGISAATAPDYLALPAVLAVGGSWMVRRSTLAARDWASVTAAASDAARLVEARR